MTRCYKVEAGRAANAWIKVKPHTRIRRVGQAFELSGAAGPLTAGCNKNRRTQAASRQHALPGARRVKTTRLSLLPFYPKEGRPVGPERSLTVWREKGSLPVRLVPL